MSVFFRSILIGRLNWPSFSKAKTGAVFPIGPDHAPPVGAGFRAGAGFLGGADCMTGLGSAGTDVETGAGFKAAAERGAGIGFATGTCSFAGTGFTAGTAFFSDDAAFAAATAGFSGSVCRALSMARDSNASTSIRSSRSRSVMSSYERVTGLRCGSCAVTGAGTCAAECIGRFETGASAARFAITGVAASLFRATAG